MTDTYNGDGRCAALNVDWIKHTQEITEMSGKVETTLDSINSMVPHLEHLDRLETIEIGITDMKNHLLSVATGKSQIPLDVAKDLFAQASKSHHALVRSYLVVIIVLVGVIGFLLTGEKLGWIRGLISP